MRSIFCETVFSCHMHCNNVITSRKRTFYDNHSSLFEHTTNNSSGNNIASWMLNDHKYFALFIYILWFNVIFWSYTQQPLTSACNVPSSCTPLNVMPLSCCQEMLPQSFENSAKLKFFPKLSPLLANHLYISCSKTILCVSAWFYRSGLFNAGLMGEKNSLAEIFGNLWWIYTIDFSDQNAKLRHPVLEMNYK